ncbi:MAG: hypothetical protein ABJ327_22985 [Litoreibacter sp.]
MCALKLEVPTRLAKHIAEWAEEQISLWPEDTKYQADLAALVAQIDLAVLSESTS